MVSTLEDRLKLIYEVFINGAKVLAFSLLIFSSNSCKKKAIHQFEKPYTGPILIVKNIEALVSDSGKAQILLNAPTQYEYQNGNRYFPNGIQLKFFEKDSTAQPSQINAKKGKFIKAKNQYTVHDNVIIRNFKERKRLDTEELNWDPYKHQIYTDKFVKIQTPEELLTGTGLVSNEDFSNYRILKVSGVFPLK